jgi:hypothetical protein
MLIGLNGVASWLCNVCGHIWPCRAVYAYGKPQRCAQCRTRAWDAPLAEDPGSELCGA